MSTILDRYNELIRRSREQALLGFCSALLGWDEQTHMPPGGAENRSAQLALLAGLQHSRATDPRNGELLGELESSGRFSDKESAEAVNIREIRRSYDRKVKLPQTLVEELARVTSKAHLEWVEARRTDDFKTLQPTLALIFDLKRQEAECLGYQDTPYDALIDEYEPGAKSAELAKVFAALRAELVPLVAAIAGSPRKPDVTILKRDYPVGLQRMFGETVASSFGFDFKRGSLDTTEHPFCTGIGPGDTRITTRFDPKNFSDAFFGILHEVGHGLYEQGLEPSNHGTPMGEAVSLGIHESQSRLWENVVGRSRPFWEFWFPIAQRVFHQALSNVSLDAFHFAINEVKPSLIRVQADEVTYNLHVLIRFEIELALLKGDLLIADLPSAWNEKYEHYLGIKPEGDAEGCLQDIHWSAGLIGYFPTYTLGNINAAQLVEAAARDLGDLSASFRRGDTSALLDWLRTKIHQQGQRHRATTLIERVTGSPTDHRPLIASLKSKYGSLYQI